MVVGLRSTTTLDHGVIHDYRPRLLTATLDHGVVHDIPENPMHYPPSSSVRIAWFSLAALVAGLVAPHMVSAADELSFEANIAPILAARCESCHGAAKVEAGLDVRRKFTLLKGGDSGPAIVDGKPDDSLVWQRISKGEMPPPDEGTLDDRQKALIRRWLEAGAPLAKSPEAPLEDAEAPSRFTDEDRQFWAFQPPRDSAPPAVSNVVQARSPVDTLVLAELEKRQLAFNPDADRRSLLRRLCFDLTGLPPTLDQQDEFLADDSPDAVERLTDRLLASPRFGERWGRHWLDVAGYADSDGYLAADRLRPEAWRYRDYVVDAHNADLPYDQFVREQLAGDELTDWRQADEISPEVRRQLIATGFLRTASDPTYPGYTEPNEIHQVMSDTLHIVGSAFLGLTIQCARCHSHKFDPISQRDYYQLQAVFLPALDPARWQPSEVRGIPLATDSQKQRIEQRNKQVDERLKQLNVELTDLRNRFRKRRVDELLAIPSERRTAAETALLPKDGKDPANTEADLVTRFTEYAEESTRLLAAIKAEQALKSAILNVRGMADLDGPIPTAHILRRGDYNKPGGSVEPAIPEIFAHVDFKFQPTPRGKSTGRRTALANWLTDPRHPLTARVHVNRLWARHFGRPLIPTPANLGRSGAPPTHPALLDWLALELPRRQWSQKSLHRLLVTSTVYRQSSATSPEKAERDPDNRWWSAWQPRRFEGEVLRDSMLAAAGRLNLDMHGKPSPVAPQGDGSVVTADDRAGNRRSVYLIVRRSQHLTMLDLFDTPMMEVNCVERSTSTVPLQALALLHGPLADQSARHLGEQLWQAADSDDARLDHAFRRLFARLPDEREKRESFEFLTVVADDQRQASGATAESARRAAWNHLALVLLNTNEFVYVD